MSAIGGLTAFSPQAENAQNKKDKGDPGAFAALINPRFAGAAVMQAQEAATAEFVTEPEAIETNVQDLRKSPDLLALNEAAGGDAAADEDLAGDDAAAAFLRELNSKTPEERVAEKMLALREDEEEADGPSPAEKEIAANAGLSANGASDGGAGTIAAEATQALRGV